LHGDERRKDVVKDVWLPVARVSAVAMTGWDESQQRSTPSEGRARALWFLLQAAQLAGSTAAVEEELADAFDHVAGHCPEPRARWLRIKATQARDFASHERHEQRHWLELRDNWPEPDDGGHPMGSVPGGGP
jgi:hypothetical protein